MRDVARKSTSRKSRGGKARQALRDAAVAPKLGEPAEVVFSGDRYRVLARDSREPTTRHEALFLVAIRGRLRVATLALFEETPRATLGRSA